jgi:AMP nucleosidase
MKTKHEIVSNWLPRYTGTCRSTISARTHPAYQLRSLRGSVCPMARGGSAGPRPPDAQRHRRRHHPDQLRHGQSQCCHGHGFAQRNRTEAALFLGKCGGVKKKNQLGDLILPIAAIRGEGTSNDYLPPEVPALPAFQLQRGISTMIRDMGRDYWTGTVYTTNRRVWEHDETFKEYLRRTRCMAVDMETATIFAAGFANRIPCGALLLVSDQPMIPEGVKTEAERPVSYLAIC